MRIASLALLSAVALALTGCTGGAHPTNSPTPAATPVFASDAEALAAAEKAYRSYVSVSDQILADGGADPDRLDRLATGKALSASAEGFMAFAAKGWRQVGRTAVSNVTLERRTTKARSAVVTYACDDVSGVDVVDQAGASVVSSSRPDRSPVEVTFDYVKGALLVSDVEAWDGGGVCSNQ